MDTYMVIFRVVHIFFGVFWVGAALFLTFLVGPAARRAGSAGVPFLLNLYGSNAFAGVMAGGAILTTITGLALWDRVSNHFNADWFQADSAIVLTVGAIAGLLAAGHGLFAFNKYTRQAKQLSQEVSGELNAEQSSTLATIQQKIMVNSYVAVGLMTVSVIGMSAARYV